MKDTYRKFQNCIFCGEALNRKNRSAEHIFGKSVAELLPSVTNWHGGPTTESTFRGSHEFRWTTSRSVCINCNTGWMRRDLESAYPTLRSLILGWKINVDQEKISHLKRYFERLAFIADAESSNLELSLDKAGLEAYAQKYGDSRLLPPIFSARERHNFKERQQVPDLHIYIGRHCGVLGRDPNFILVRQLAALAFAKRIVFVIGQLAVLIEFKSALRTMDPKMYALAPPASCNLQFVSKETFSYDDFFSLMHQDRIVRWLRFLIRNRATRRQMESEHRKNGEWIYPPIPDSFS